METINGAFGEGGGQIFRSSLTLAMCLGKAVRIENIRAGRRKPGLLRQHLTCLRAAQEISGAAVEGDYLGSKTVTFTPGKPVSGRYRFAVGSAGSTTLVFQTICLALLMADGESEVYLEGGTHNGMAPSYEFIDRCFVPLMKKTGYDIETSLQRYGFYPAGGGAWLARIKPSKQTKRLELEERGDIIRGNVLAISANIPDHVNEREINKVLRLTGWGNADCESKRVSSCGPGNVLSLSLESEALVEVFDEQGEVGVRAEQVAERAFKNMRRYIDAGVPVGEYLADQLILPLTLGCGGVFKTLTPSQHLLTNIEVVKQLTGKPIEIAKVDGGAWRVSVG